MVEGVFSRGSRTNIRPIELGRRLVREMDDQRSVDVKGRRVVPNDFVVQLSAEGPRGLRRHRRRAADRARRGRPRVRPQEGYHFLGPVKVELSRRRGARSPAASTCSPRCARRPTAAPAPARSSCRRASGSPLGDTPGHRRAPARVHDPAQRPERQPPPRRDPPDRQTTSSSTSARPTARWSTARGSTARRRSATATSSASARPTYDSRRPDSPGRAAATTASPTIRPIRPCAPNWPSTSSSWSCWPLLYLFFARVLWAVWSEVRTDRRVVASHTVNERSRRPRAAPVPKPRKAPKGRRGTRRAARHPRTEGASVARRSPLNGAARSPSAATPAARA